MLGCERGLCKWETGVLHRAPSVHLRTMQLRLRSAVVDRGGRMRSSQGTS
jgi:hypothetical protein